MADTKISALSAATALAGTEKLPVVQAAATVAATATQIKTFCSASPTLVTPALGTPVSGALTNCTFPTLNQSTTGSAATLTTARTINGVSFNGSANITVTAAGSTLSDTVPVTKGGTGLTALGTGLQVLRTNTGATAAEWATLSTGGDVTAASSFGTDGLPIVSDGTGKGVKAVSTISAATVTTLTVTNPFTLPSGSTLVAPVLGTPASGTLTNCTADGTNLLGYRGVPQNSQSAAYTTVLADAGKEIYHPVGDANARTFTLDSNANVAYPIGTVIVFTNMSASAVTIAIASDTLYLFGAGTTGSRTLAQYGTAAARKLTSTTWGISGTNLT